jgi:hypothetical protein
VPLTVDQLRAQTRPGAPSRTDALARLPASSTHRGTWASGTDYNPGDVVAARGANWVWTVQSDGSNEFDELLYLNAVVPLSDAAVYRTVRTRQLDAYVERCRDWVSQGNNGRPPRNDLRFLTEEECERAFPLAVVGRLARPQAPPPAAFVPPTPAPPPPPGIDEPAPRANPLVMQVMQRGLQMAYRELGEAHDLTTNFVEVAARVLENHISSLSGVSIVDVRVVDNHDTNRYRFEVSLELQGERRMHQVAFNVTPDFLVACRNLAEGRSLEVTLNGPNHPAFTFRLDNRPNYQAMGTATGRLRSSSPNLSSESAAEMADRVVNDARRRVPRAPAPAPTKGKTSARAKAPDEVFPWEEV